MMSNVNKGVPAFLGVSGGRVWRKLGSLSRILLHQPLGVVRDRNWAFEATKVVQQSKDCEIKQRMNQALGF